MRAVQDSNQVNALLIQLDQVALRDQSKLILSNIDLSVNAKEITTVIGPNGAGKSSLVKLITGLTTPSSGSIYRAPQLKIGYMPQSVTLGNTMPINVDRFLALVEPNHETRREVLRRLGISHLAQSQIQRLSGGEFQRVLLARAVLRKPNLLVLDEPLQGVDINGQLELYRLIAALRDEMHCAIVMVSHDLRLVMAQTDNVICLNQHVCCQGQAQSVSQHPEYLRLFGNKAAADIAVYTHHHDHQHDIHGDVVETGKR